MTPDATADSPGEASKQIPSTAGMTTKVVKGSMWTLAGQVAPLMVSLVTTPFVIRMLGAEGYGVLALIALLPVYFGFADLGMSIASTKFASEAYASGSPKKEAALVRTAVVLALIASAPVALGIFFFSGHVAAALNVPVNLLESATLALRFAAITFFLNILSSILNTPQLTRLRMDINTIVTSGFRVIGIIASPLVLLAGGGIATVASVLMLCQGFTVVAHLFASHRLLSCLFEPTIEPRAIGPMLRYGVALAGASIAGVLLINLEKLVLVSITSVETFAYYSVAFTLALMATTLSASMTQSLVPAFSQLLDAPKKAQLEVLFFRAIRINFLVMLPILAFLFVAARPFFTLWAGEDFGRESTVPFYILLTGVFFATNNYAPISLLMASGRSGLIATIYWAELLPYLGVIAVLTLNFGAVGAATAWTIRVILDTSVITWLAIRQAEFSLRPTGNWQVLVALACLITPLAVLAVVPAILYPLLILSPLLLGGYAILVWQKFMALDEKRWLRDRIRIR